MRFRTLLWRGFRLRCPYCGRGKLFRNWLKMHQECSSCGESFQRESGFFLGSIYINYGLTSLIVAVAYPILLFNGVLSNTNTMLVAASFVFLFPVWFFRYARSLWFNLDQYFDPREVKQPQEETQKKTNVD